LAPSYGTTLSLVFTNPLGGDRATFVDNLSFLQVTPAPLSLVGVELPVSNGGFEVYRGMLNGWTLRALCSR
jgi:hypothetical protein